MSIKNKPSVALFLIALCFSTISINSTFATSCLANSSFGRAALSWASKNGCKNVVKLLIGGKANINSKDDYGMTALMWAAKNGQKGVVEVLIDNRANLEAKNKNEDTAIIWASYQGYKDVVEVLISNRANLEAKNKNEDTAIICASYKGYKDIVEVLISNNANLEAKNKNEDTAIICASYKGFKDVVKVLIESGANINSKDNSGNTAIMWATRKGHKEILELLIDNNANIEARDISGDTALVIAIRIIIKEERIMGDGYIERVKKNKECVKSLIESKSDISDISYIFNSDFAKIEFLKCIPAGVIMTKIQIMQLGRLGVSEEEIKSKEIVLFARRYNHLGRVVYYWGYRVQCNINSDLCAIIINFAIYTNRWGNNSNQVYSSFGFKKKSSISSYSS